MKKRYQFPLKQNIGEAAVPAIVSGETIVRGQLIAFKGDNSLGANIYSSVTGVVSEVNEKQITILAQEEQNRAYKPLMGKEPLALIEEAGIVGLGGAGFPTYAKLTKPFGKGGSVVINAAECEPVLAHNIAFIEKHPEKLLRGLEILMEVVNAREGIIAIKEKHRNAVECLNKILESEAMSMAERIRLVLLPDLYPMGEERAVIREITGQILPVDCLPISAGAIVVNAETAGRVQEAVDLKKPFIDKDITVAGKIKGNENLMQVFEDVPLGISAADVFEMAGGLSDDYGEIIMGGPFTGKRIDINAPVIKTTGGLIAAECFMKGPENIGLLVCACGADRNRLEELAESLGSWVVGVEYCKQAIEVKGTRKCENPGRCPGQVQKVMALKKAGAQGVLISNCTDCSNTVMSCAPKMGLSVYHCTDGALRAVNHPLVRRIKKQQKEGGR